MGIIRDRNVEEEVKKDFNTAIFYSISSHGNNIGLAQIDLGNHMIKNAVKYLKSENSKINTFSTLSPIPGFRKWLKTKSDDDFGKKFIKIHDKDDILEFVKQNDTEIRRYVSEYLYLTKRRGQAIDGVANFHLRNGAAIYRINTLANKTDKGIAESYGYMVNYKYDLEMIEARQE